jgi:membrane-bound metal-dependent hydrolase YbcI (DUF457 family)
MRWHTHAAAGITSLWLLKIMPPELLGYDFGSLATCAVLGALLPDLDAAESKIKHLRLFGTGIKPFFLPGRVVSATDQHRGLLHSVAGVGIVAILCIPLPMGIGWAPYVALLTGYTSHFTA